MSDLINTIFGIRLTKLNLRRILKKIDNRYVLPEHLIELYLTEHKRYRKAKGIAEDFYNKQFPLKGIDKYVLINEYIMMSLARENGDYFKYCFHIYRQIEYVFNRFSTNIPGDSLLVKSVNRKSQNGKKIIENIFSIRLPDTISNWEAKILKQNNKHLTINQTKELFIKLLYFDPMCPFFTLQTTAASLTSRPNLDTWQLIKYFRDCFGHSVNFDAPKVEPSPGFVTLSANQLVRQKYFDLNLKNPELIINSNDAEKYLEMVVCLYNELLNGNINI